MKNAAKCGIFLESEVNYFTATGLPNSTQVLPSNLTSCIVWNNAKSAGDVLASTPGKAIGT
jgi:hypothetical protein